MEKNKDSTNTWMNLNVTNMCVLIGIALTLSVYLCICVSVFCSKNPMPKQSPENIQKQKTWKIPMFSGQRHKSSKEVIIFLACLLIVPVRKSLRDSSCLFHIGDGQISLQCHNTKKDQDQRIFEPGRWDRWDAIGLYAKLDALPSRCFFQVSKCQPPKKNRVKNRCDIKKKSMLHQNLLHHCTFQLLQPYSLPNKILVQLQHPSCWDPMHLPKSPYLAGQHEPWNT